MQATLEGSLGQDLTKEEMEAISMIDKGCRLIKGQVFLWPHAKDWTDLWDLDGSVPS
jgi:hypothetical protein